MMWNLVTFFLSLHICFAVRTIDNSIAPPELVYTPSDTVWQPQCEVRGAKLDLVFVLDSSGSLKQQYFEDEVNVIRRILEIVAIAPDATRVALIQFSGSQHTEFSLHTMDNKRNVLQALDTIRFMNGITRLGAALKYATTELTPEKGMRGPEVPKVLFLLSDGRAHDFPAEKVWADKLRKMYPTLHIWAFGTGEYVATETLVNITMDVDKIVTNKNLKRIQQLFEPFHGVEICEEKPVCILGSDRPLDLMFVLDSSTSVDSIFTAQRNFILRLLNLINVHPKAVQVALITYTATANVIFDFKTYSNTSHVKDAVFAIRRRNGITRTDLGLKKAFRLFNNPASGVREGVPKMAIVLTDGHSMIPPNIYARRLARLLNVTIFAVASANVADVDLNELIDITDRKGAERVYTESNLHTFEETFAHYIGRGCPDFPNVSEFLTFVRGAVQTRCQENAMSVGIRTRDDFYGWFYVKDRFDDSACVVRGDGSRGASLTLIYGGQVPQCGLQRLSIKNDTFEGFRYNVTVMLQFHTDVVTRVDQALHVECFYEAPLLNKLEGLTSKAAFTTNCAYSLSRYQKDGCVALDAKVGEHLYHHWSCNSPKFYGMLIHDCFVESDVKTLPILDEDGCAIDDYIMETPIYDTFTYDRAWRDFAVFKYPTASSLRFRCKISLCDIEQQDSDCKFMIPYGTEKQPPHCKSRTKRRVTTTRTGFVTTIDVETRRLNVLENENLKPNREFTYCQHY